MKTNCKLVMAGALGLAALSPAQAIVINSTFGAENAALLGSDFGSVVRINITGPNGVVPCTGSLISAVTILTAKHCTSGLGVSAFTVDFDRNGNGLMDGGTDVRINVIKKLEADNSPTNPNLTDGTDVAILTLGNAAPAWASSFKLLSAVTVGSKVTMVGYGEQGVDSKIPGSFGRSRWAAENIVDTVGSAGFNLPYSTNIISTDFDNGTALGNTLGGNPLNSSATPLYAEGTTAPGDSGGPLLFYMQNTWFIGGVLSGGSDINSSFGDISWWTGLARYRSALEDEGAEFLSPIPEPASWAMVLMGLCAFGALGRRRKLR